jgi:RNA polymerase sigma-70 factor, ECF subfamily
MTTAAAEFATLATPHMPRLFRLGMRLTRQPTDSADLVQEALVKAWANWARFERGGSLGAYLSRILVNTFISSHRHTRVVDAAAARKDLVDHLFDHDRMDAASTPERVWLRRELSDEVLDALDALPEHYRQVVELVDLDGVSYKEASQHLDIPLGTVMSRLHRARRLMRKQLSQYARDYGFGCAPSSRVSEVAA